MSTVPQTSRLQVDIRGAKIIDDPHLTKSAGGQEGVKEENSSNYGEPSDIYLPEYTEWISHIAVDIGGSLAKVVYFTRTPSLHHLVTSSRSHSPSTLSSNSLHVSTPPLHPDSAVYDEDDEIEPHDLTSADFEPLQHVLTLEKRRRSVPPSPRINGILGPQSVRSTPSTSRSNSISHSSSPPSSMHVGRDAGYMTTHRRGSLSGDLPGGRLNFVKFETTDLSALTNFIHTLLRLSAESHNIPLPVFKQSVKILATGGGAHVYGDILKEELGVEVRRYAEMDCLIEGLAFVMEVEGEVFWYSDQLVRDLTHPSTSTSLSTTSSTIPSISPQPPIPLERPSPDPPRYSILFEKDPKPQFPCLLVNIGSGVSILRVDDYDKFERVSGTSLGGGTLWGLLSLLTGAGSFDEMLELSERGDNSTVDMLVGDIYGSNQDLAKMGLKSSTIASSFGKVFKKGQQKRREWRAEDISKSLLYAISNNIGQIAYMNAEKQNVDKIFFSGCFIRGHAATMATLSYAIRFWSKGTKRALFLRHEGYLGALGAWMKNMEKELAQ